MKTALRAGDPVHDAGIEGAVRQQGRGARRRASRPFGLARIARPGRDITIVAAGQIVHRALEAARALAAEGIEAEVIDLRTIMPLDVETVAASVRKTHRLLVADEGWGAFGVGAETGAGDERDRLSTISTARSPGCTPSRSRIRSAPALERAMLVDAAKLVAAIRRVIAGVAPVPRHWRALGGRTAAPQRPLPPPAPAGAVPPDRAGGRHARRRRSRSPCRSAT